jgi:hypothetical protein
MAFREGSSKPKLLEGDGEEYNTGRKMSPEHHLATRRMNI